MGAANARDMPVPDLATLIISFWVVGQASRLPAVFRF
jgi:hypothetical protein